VAAAPKPAPQSDLLKRILTRWTTTKPKTSSPSISKAARRCATRRLIASGRSSRHVGAMAEHLARRLKESGYGTRPSAARPGRLGAGGCGRCVVHLFRPEVRDYYDLEGMWSVGSKK